MATGPAGSVDPGLDSAGRVGDEGSDRAVRRDGVPNTEIADRTGTSRPTVLKWRGRYEQAGVDGLDDVPLALSMERSTLDDLGENVGGQGETARSSRRRWSARRWRSGWGSRSPRWPGSGQLEHRAASSAVALGRDGAVGAKGTFNSYGQLESILATAERRLAEAHA